MTSVQRGSVLHKAKRKSTPIFSFKQFFACSVAKLGSQISFGSTAAIARFFIQRFRPFEDENYFDIFVALIFTVLLYGQ